MKLKWMQTKYRDGRLWYKAVIGGEVVWEGTNKETAQGFLNIAEDAIEVEPHMIEFLRQWGDYIPEDKQAGFAQDVAQLYQDGIEYAQENVGDWYEPRR